MGTQRLGGEPEEGDGARASDADDVILVGGGVHLVVIDEPVGDRGAAERVEARADDDADFGRVDLELVDGPDGVAEELLLDGERATLNGGGEQLVGQIEVAAVDATAAEDALGELVVGQPEQRQDLILGERGVGMSERHARDPRERSGEVVLGGESRDTLAGVPV